MPALPDPLWLQPFTRPVRGSITLPGSKSITNRALILAALGHKTVTLRGALFSRDTQIMIAALQTLGFAMASDESARTITITGGNGYIPVREATLDIGNAGTAARFLTAFVCLRPDGCYHFDGDEAMRRRPIGALLDSLELQGARASARTFPFTLKTAGLRGGNVLLDASESSQMLSALLLVGPHASSPLRITLSGDTVSRPFVGMTERMVQQFSENPTDYAIEPDATAASYFLTLPQVTRGSVAMPGLQPPGSGLQGDAAFAEVFARAQARSGYVLSTENFHEISDTFLTLAAVSPLLDGPTRITGIAHTRKQETDRVAGMARELTRLGQHVIETDDSLEIHPRPLRAGQLIETYHDHRFAMSFGILGCHDLHGDGRPWLAIRNPACCSKTFPNFFELLASLREKSLEP